MDLHNICAGEPCSQPSTDSGSDFDSHIFQLIAEQCDFTTQCHLRMCSKNLNAIVKCCTSHRRGTRAHFVAKLADAMWANFCDGPYEVWDLDMSLLSASQTCTCDKTCLPCSDRKPCTCRLREILEAALSRAAFPQLGELIHSDQLASSHACLSPLNAT